MTNDLSANWSKMAQVSPECFSLRAPVRSIGVLQDAWSCPFKGGQPGFII